MIVIGVVGGIASGKSFVTQHLESLGAVVLDADKIGHGILLKEAVKAAVRDHWGDDVFNPQGEIDRSRLAAVVFDKTQPQQLHRLEEITHPLIEKQLQLEIRQIRDARSTTVLVLDAPVMVKAGWHVLCDEIVFVDASDAVRWQRASQRGWTRQMFENREAMQATIDEKRRTSSFVVDNNGNRESTEQQINHFWRTLVQPNS